MHSVYLISVNSYLWEHFKSFCFFDGEVTYLLGYIKINLAVEIKGCFFYVYLTYFVDKVLCVRLWKKKFYSRGENLPIWHLVLNIFRKTLVWALQRTFPPALPIGSGNVVLMFRRHRLLNYGNSACVCVVQYFWFIYWLNGTPLWPPFIASSFLFLFGQFRSRKPWRFIVRRDKRQPCFLFVF